MRAEFSPLRVIRSRSGVNAGLFLKHLTWVDCWLLFLGNPGDISWLYHRTMI